MERLNELYGAIKCCARGILRCFILVSILSLVLTRAFAELSWDYQPMHLGRVLYEGGWYQEYSLGQINASPEFRFPLQLIYLNKRSAAGLFGAQWFCPQLESTIIPKGAGTLVWQMPSGSEMAFLPDPEVTDQFRSMDSTWLLKGDIDRMDIWNQEGWTFRYKEGHLLRITSPTGRSLEYVWNNDCLLGFRLVDPATNQQQNWLSMEYSDDKRAVSMSFNGVQHKFYYEKGRFGRLSWWVNPNKQQLSFIYADVGVLEYAKIVNGDTSTFTTQVDDPRLTLSDQKDPAHWKLVQDPDNKYTYRAAIPGMFTLSGTQITATSNTGLVYAVDYNSRRGVITESNPGGMVRTTYFYEAPGQKYNGKLRKIEENGKLKIEYFYDPNSGLLSRIMDANGEATNFEYPDKWKPTHQNPWDPKPITVWKGDKQKPDIIGQYWYDDSGRLIASQDAAGKVIRTTYTSRGEIDSVTDSDGSVSKLSYDAFGRCTQIIMGDHSESVEYDSLGRVASHTGPDGVKTEFSYDEIGNVAQVTRNGKPVIQYVRDETGKITGEKDALGRTRKIDSDAHGNVRAEYAPDNSVTKYEYDKYNRRTAQIDANNNKITFEFDPGSHLTRQVNALGDTINWAYDAQDRLAGQDNGVQKIKYTYDENNRVSNIDYGAPDQRVAFTYDDHGRIASQVTPATAFYYLYDKLGRTDAIREICGSDEQLLRFFYNYNGQRTGLILAKLSPAIAPKDGKIGYDARYDVLQQTEYTYENHRLNAIISDGKPVVTYKYDSAGRPVLKTFGNGVQASLSYDSAGHLSQIVFAGGPIESPLTLAYQWDLAEQVVQRSWNGQVLQYEYDPCGRLSKVTQIIDGKPSQELEKYVYDKAGNITEKTLQGQKTTLTYNAANELTTASVTGGPTITYSYDKAGRLVGFTGGPTTTYGWLNKAVQTTEPNGASVAFTYWPDGQLAAKIPLAASESIQKAAYSSGQPEVEHFLWDGLALLRRDDTIYVVEPHPSGGATVASHPIGKPSEMTYYINDLLGTTLAVIEKDGIQFTNLTSFGEMRGQTQPRASPQPATLQALAPSAPITSSPQQLPPAAQ